MVNRKLVIVILAITLILSGAFFVSATTTNGLSPQTSINEKQTIAAVKEIANNQLKGVVDEVEFKQNKTGNDYKVKVELDNQDIILAIDAYTGNILYQQNLIQKDGDDLDYVNLNEVVPKMKHQYKRVITLKTNQKKR